MARTLTIPETRSEPESEEVVWIQTPLGTSPVVVDFSGDEPLPPKIGLRGRVELNRVDYKWELTCQPEGKVKYGQPQPYQAGRWDLSRADWQDGKATTNAAYVEFERHLPALVAAAAAWVEENPELIHRRLIHNLEHSLYYHELEAQREADTLERKLEEIAELERQLARAEGRLKLEVEKRSRRSGLAA